MPFDWAEFLALARHLQVSLSAPCSAEAVHRTSVSRAYYAAFCHARNFAERILGLRRARTAQDHVLLRKHLRKMQWFDVAEYLEELRKWRNQCDYDDAVSNFGLLVSGALERSETIIRQCK
jgi:uncharacterized protein (UPF0332 family)